MAEMPGKVAGTGHVGRRIIALTPVLLVLGIVAQIVLLTVAIVLYAPLLIWPAMLDGTYQWITKGMARIMAKAIVGKKREPAKPGVIIP